MSRSFDQLTREEQRRFDARYGLILNQTADIQEDPEEDDSAARAHHDRAYRELLIEFDLTR